MIYITYYLGSPGGAREIHNIYIYIYIYIIYTYNVYIYIEYVYICIYIVEIYVHIEPSDSCVTLLPFGSRIHASICLPNNQSRVNSRRASGGHRSTSIGDTTVRRAARRLHTAAQ